MKTRVVVGMSGGVDSSVVAALLLRQGYDVIGITLKMWPQDCASLIEDKCCGPQAMTDARTVAEKLGIAHYVLDETSEFEKSVINYFSSEYQQGRTPNPCVICNHQLKFGRLLNKALGLGASYIATGHYARIAKEKNGYFLQRAIDRKKDQSYFLFTLNQEQLSHALMPLGELSKAEVRAIARDYDLPVYDKEESQDICFVPEDDYTAFLKNRLQPAEFQSGEVVHQNGRVLGHHQGIEFFTIGQRKGIGISYPTPLYVLDIDVKSRRVIVGEDRHLWQDTLMVERACWNFEGKPTDGTQMMVKIRSHHEGAKAIFSSVDNNCFQLQFEEPQRAITPGQAAVFYQSDVVIGGGWIVHKPIPK